jgi:hypothetical protein
MMGDPNLESPTRLGHQIRTPRFPRRAFFWARHPSSRRFETERKRAKIALLEPLS